MVGKEDTFWYEVKYEGGVLQLHLFGYVDADSARRYLADVEVTLKDTLRTTRLRAIGLMMVGSVSGFDASRTAQIHGAWFKKMGPAISRIAVVSSRTTTTLAVSVLRLASKHAIRQFDTPEEAMSWLVS